ncbi:unnamed protein product [Schistocephalus solidus]|uniref:Pecanex-like protein n=1 Tax=Schistocephalus solidus TaxID=70667 RepID=A0A183SV00_SCHSO|nr:unnamed protein product [Schistocephalus solidus]
MAASEIKTGVFKGRYPSNYLWYAVATWLSGSLTQPLSLGSAPGQALQDSLLSQFLVVLLCISVVMFGLVGVVRLLSCIFRLFFLEPRTIEQLATAASAGVPRSGLPPQIRLLSPCPPPSVHFCAELGCRSVWTDASRHSLRHTQSAPVPTPSTSDPLSPVRIVGTVLSGGNPGQYVLLPNSSPSVTYCSTERRGQIALAVTDIPPSLPVVSRGSTNPVACPNNSRLRHPEQVIT